MKINWKSLKIVLKHNPEYASPAYNIISYAYAWGEGVEQDLEKAILIIENSITTHEGPNGYDLTAEHYAGARNFEKVLTAN